MGKRATTYRWLFLVLPVYAAFAFGPSGWPLAGAFAAAIIAYNLSLSFAERRWPDWTRSRAVFLRCVEIGLACIALSLVYLEGRNADLFEFYYDGFYAVPVIFAASAAGRRGLYWSAVAAMAAVAFGQVLIVPQPEVVLSWAGLGYWLGVATYAGIYGVFFATVGGLAQLVREYASRKQRDLVLRLASSFGRLRDAVLITDATGRIMSANPAAAELFGWKSHELFSRGIEELCPGVRIVESKGATDSEPIEILARTRDAREFPCEVTVSAYRMEGEPLAHVVVARDASARIKIERQLAQQSRLAVIGTLTSGVAHDIDNPLTGIKGLAELLLEDPRPEHETEALGMIRDEAVRVGTMVRDLLHFARADSEDREIVELNDIMERTLKLRSFARGPSAVQVHRKYAVPSPRAYTHAAKLEQVLLNLVTNAEQAMGEGGELIVRTWGSGDRSVIEIEDAGPGIPVHLLERIFDPFFTTKPAGKGTGLGLYIARDLVRGQGGEMRVHSEPGKGACFTVELPATWSDAVGPSVEPRTSLRAVS